MSPAAEEKPISAARARTRASGAIGHQAAHVLHRAVAGAQFVDLVLGQIGDLQLVRPHHAALLGREPVGQQLGEGGLAVAVRPEEGEYGRLVDAQIELLEDGLVRLIAHVHVVEGRRWAGRAAFPDGGWRWAGASENLVRQRFHAGQRLEARTAPAWPWWPWRGSGRRRLPFGRAGFLLLCGPSGPATGARGAGGRTAVAAAIERQLVVEDVEDVIHRRVQEVAVMADEDDRARIMREIILKPERAFEVEIVGVGSSSSSRVRLGEKQGRERHAHAPAAGEFRAGAGLRRSSKRDRRECAPPAPGRKGVDVHQRISISAMRCGSVAVSFSLSSAARSVSPRAPAPAGCPGRRRPPAPRGRCGCGSAGARRRFRARARPSAPEQRGLAAPLRPTTPTWAFSGRQPRHGPAAGGLRCAGKCRRARS